MNQTAPAAVTWNCIVYTLSGALKLTVALAVSVTATPALTKIRSSAVTLGGVLFDCGGGAGELSPPPAPQALRMNAAVEKPIR